MPALLSEACDSWVQMLHLLASTGLGHSMVSKEALGSQGSLWLSCQPPRAWEENEARAEAAWPEFLLDVSL